MKHFLTNQRIIRQFVLQLAGRLTISQHAGMHDQNNQSFRSPAGCGIRFGSLG